MHITKWRTGRTYLSKIKTLIERNNDETDIAKNDWYSQLLKRVKSERNKITEGNMKDCAPEMTTEDLETLCMVLFLMNDVKSCSDRALLLVCFHCISRISAGPALVLSKLRYVVKVNIRTIGAKTLEGKTFKDLLIFMHVRNFKVCPLHALCKYL